MSEMIFYFKAAGDMLSIIDVRSSTHTGNVGSYLCSFELNEDWSGLYTVAVFTIGDNSYSVLVSDSGECYIPYEATAEVGIFTVGLVGTNAGEENLRRIATNRISIPAEGGVYYPGKAPSLPDSDMWEKLINRNIPKIGENGNWYIWDIEKNKYIDSGMPSSADVEIDDDINPDSLNPVRNSAVAAALKKKENTGNKIVSIDENSTDEQYPSAKAVYEQCTNMYNELGSLCTAICADKEDKSNRYTSSRGRYPSNLKDGDERYPSLYFLKLRDEEIGIELEGKEFLDNKIIDTDDSRPWELWNDSPFSDDEYFNANIVAEEFYKLHSEIEALQSRIAELEAE